MAPVTAADHNRSQRRTAHRSTTFYVKRVALAPFFAMREGYWLAAAAILRRLSRPLIEPEHEQAVARLLADRVANTDPTGTC